MKAFMFCVAVFKGQTMQDMGVTGMAGIAMVENEQEARETATEKVLKEFPLTDGWRVGEVSVTEMTLELIQQIHLRLMRTKRQL